MGLALMVAVSSTFFREGIRKILESEKDIEIIAEASTHQEIITLLEQKKPDVLFIDSGIPNLDIVKILEYIEEKSTGTKVLLLLHTLSEEAIINALSLGVWGYLTDTSCTGHFIQAVRAVSKGEMWAERRIITKAFARLLPQTKAKPVLIKPKLTKRKEEIIRLILQGNSNKQISKKLLISEKTVKAHLTNIFHELGLSNRLNLALDFLSESNS
ncbi:MAG: response regulator transcription factor [Deltaproteobacteria bacterium]|nr:response regulator transcription factor [Deltaproteobacteria bacterium]